MRRQDNILMAPGIGDDTANLVNLMMGAAFLAEHQDQLATGIMVVANSCEEGLGNLKGCREIFNHYGNRIRAFYSFDGYMSMCTSIPVGSHRYRIQVLARGGHSYQDFGRDNAIHICRAEHRCIVPDSPQKRRHHIQCGKDKRRHDCEFHCAGGGDPV